MLERKRAREKAQKLSKSTIKRENSTVYSLPNIQYFMETMQVNH